MKHTAILRVPKGQAIEMQKLCDAPSDTVGKCEVVFDEEVDFGNGRVMAIQVVGTNDPRAESCWTQGVLFYKGDASRFGGHELHEIDSSVGDNFLGEYTVGECQPAGEDNEYAVLVTDEWPRLELHKSQFLEGLRIFPASKQKRAPKTHEISIQLTGPSHLIRAWAERIILAVNAMGELEKDVEDMDFTNLTGHCPDEGCPGVIEGDETCSHCGDDYKENLVDESDPA